MTAAAVWYTNPIVLRTRYRAQARDPFPWWRTPGALDGCARGGARAAGVDGNTKNGRYEAGRSRDGAGPGRRFVGKPAARTSTVVSPLPRNRWSSIRPARRASSAKRLRGAVRGDVLFDRASRGRYATDASIYQVEPIGVLVPAIARRRARGVRRLPRARACRCSPRGAGSSQCGQTVGAALVVDHSKHLNGIVAFDRDAMTVDRRARRRARRSSTRGCVRTACGFRSTSARRRSARSAAWRATIRAARARSPTATWCTTCSRSTRCSPTAREARFGAEAAMQRRARARARAGRGGCARSAQRERDEIERGCRTCCAASAATTSTSIIRRASGRIRADGSVNLAHLLVGSEGTLAWTRALTLKLAPLPTHRTLGVVNFPTLYRAMECTRHIVDARPVRGRARRPHDDRSRARQSGVSHGDRRAR